MKAIEALEILKEYIEDENRLGDLNYAHYSNIIDYVNEALQELEHLNSQCCDNCIYFSNTPTPSKDGYCTNVQNGTYDLEYDTETSFDVNKDFCCNKWKRNNNV
jgi:hypothetical protein